ncbi:MAG: Na(+)-translocating NADH-quinone reductase subunit C [Pirellulales bacterium]
MWRDTVGGTFTVAAVLCVVCSVLVSAAAVGLRPRQDANKDRFRKQNILIAAGVNTEGKTVDKAFENIETQIIDLSTGEVSIRDDIDPATYDQKKAAKDPTLSIAIEPEKDIGGIKRREKYSRVYLVKENGVIKKIILPVYGKGLWSTLYGFLALDADVNTVAGLTFYEHKETPGLGGEVDNRAWKAKWPGKLIHDSDGQIQLEVLKGAVPEGSPNADYQVDGLTGATITSRGVSNLIRYWLSDDGFGLFLNRLKAEGGRDG